MKLLTTCTDAPTSLDKKTTAVNEAYVAVVNAAMAKVDSPQQLPAMGDLYDRLKHESSTGSTLLDASLEAEFRCTMLEMQKALTTYNKQATQRGEKQFTIEELVPRLTNRTERAIENAVSPTNETVAVAPAVRAIQARLNAAIVGQGELREQVLIALMTGGHILLEGPTGTGKSMASKLLGTLLDGSYQRIQFTQNTNADDITGAVEFDEERYVYEFRQGPVFAEVVHADEINRSPPKTQSALLEAMGEHQVTVGDTSHPLPELSFIIATQNPGTHEGTYPLPEAEYDRFAVSVELKNPTGQERIEIDRMTLHNTQNPPSVDSKIPLQEILDVQAQVKNVHVPEELYRYMAALLDGGKQEELREEPSPRAFESLRGAAQARAYLDGRMTISEDDVRASLKGALRHRLFLTDDARDNNRTVDAFIEDLLETVEIPKSDGAVS